MRCNWKNVCKTAFAVLVCLAIGSGFFIRNALALRELEGERTFYLHSVSSQGLIKTGLGVLDLPYRTGESVQYALTAGAESEAERVLTIYDAELLWTEEACGVKCYYALSPRLGAGVWIDGRLVNLHIAVCEDRCAVGTPIIFGGF